MSFVLEKIEAHFPKELSEQKKGRLREGLKQFTSTNSNSKIYTDFYLFERHNYFLQGDLINDLRYPIWNSENKNYEKVYFNVIIISNSCDIDEANQRDVPKKVLIAKLFELSDFKEGLIQNHVENTENIIRNLKSQEYSNLMYFPPINGIEYVAFLDELSWITNDELNLLKNDIQENRIASLDLFGYYLFMFKLSYHLCRLPEEADR
jgi:hypothetical protein